METYLFIAVIVVVSILSTIVALVLEPKEISDDVMGKMIGDAPAPEDWH